MAPVAQGFWGPTTSTLDWCESNYQVSYYVAEFWNTVSNLGIILPGLWGAWHSWRGGVEKIYVIAFLNLSAVGVGSWLFHMTLLYQMQLLDELPMIYGGLLALYLIVEIRAPTEVNWVTSTGFVAYGLFCTIVYLVSNIPLIFQISYGVVVAATAILDMRRARSGVVDYRLFVVASGLFFVAFVLWNIDNVWCRYLTLSREAIPNPLRPMTQLHAWWHVLTGYSTYIHIAFCLQSRCSFLGRRFVLEGLGFSKAKR